MIRFLIIVALVWGAFWVYNNVDFEALGNSTINTLKKEKTLTNSIVLTK